MNRQVRPARGRKASLAKSNAPALVGVAVMASLGMGASAPAARAADDRVRLDDVVVTAPRTAAPLTVETNPKLARTPLPAADGAGYLKSIPGFSVIRKGGSSGDPVFRGMSGSRLNLLIDGTPLLGGCGMRMDPPTSYIFPESYDRITVLKGPQGVIHGGGAVGGTVLIERNTPRFTEPGVRAQASALYGSYNRNDQMLDATAGMREGYVRFIGTHAQSDDYRDGNGDRVHSRYSRESGTAILGWTPDATSTLEASVDVSEARAAYADRMMDGSVFDRQGLRFKYTETDISPTVTKFEAHGYYDYVDHVMDRYNLRTFSGGMMAVLNNPDREVLGGQALIELAPFAGTTVTVGADFNHDEHTGRSLSAVEYRTGVSYQDKMRTPDLTAVTTGFFAEAAQELDQASRLVGGYRVNMTRVVDETSAAKPRDHDTLHNAFGRYEREINLGAPVTAYVGLGHSQRTPDYWERKRNFSLAPERTTQLDVGVLHEGEKLRASLSAFYAHIDDYMLLSATTGKNIDAATVGGEAEVSYRFLPSWTIEATLSLVHGENLTDDKPLAQMPPLEGTLALRYDDGTFLGGVLARAAAGQDRVDVGWGNIVGSDLGDTGGFAVFSANAGWRARQGLVISAGVDNILDQTYAEHISRPVDTSVIADGYQRTTRVNEPGRTFWIKGSLLF